MPLSDDATSVTPASERSVLALPSSGQVLGAIVEAFDLQALDVGGFLSTAHARRHLRGKQGQPDTEPRVLQAVSAALAAAGVMPPGRAGAAEVANDALERTVASEALRGLLAPALARWDAIAAELGATTLPTSAVRRARASVLRLVVIDLATRVAAARWLLQRERARPLCESWGQTPSAHEWLRGAVDRAGLTSSALSRSLGITSARVEALLAGAARPTEGEIHGLTEALGSKDPTSARGSASELRARYAMCAIRSQLADAIGNAPAEEMVERFLTYTNTLLALMQRTGRAPTRREVRLRELLSRGTELAKGTDSLWLLSMLRIVWKAEDDLQWRNSLRAATGSWPAHLSFALGTAPRSEPSEPAVESA